MRVLIVVAAVVILMPADVGAQEHEEIERFLLYTGCAAVMPMYSVNETQRNDGDSIDLTKERIGNMVESRLRAARLYYNVFDDMPPEKRPDSFVILWVHATVLNVAFSFNLEMNKNLQDPLAGISGSATTWDIGRFGTHGGDAGYIVQSISEGLDEFILNYLRVNEDACD